MISPNERKRLIEGLTVQAANVEDDGWLNAARYMREAAGILSDLQVPIWKLGDGACQNDVAGFVRLVQDNPGFWTSDFALKYLEVRVDTRAGGHFSVRDRDGNPIDPARVLAAIEAQSRGRSQDSKRGNQ